MPFTPFHGGPGVMLKALFPESVSLAAFLATQVIVDCETAYHLFMAEYPLHRMFHTLLGGTLAGCAVAVGVVTVGRSPSVRRHLAGDSLTRSEGALRPALMGGVVGGTSHSLLDSIVHADVRPFWPFTDASPLNASFSWGTVELTCVVSGLLGAALVYWRIYEWRISR